MDFPILYSRSVVLVVTLAAATALPSLAQAPAPQAPAVQPAPGAGINLPSPLTLGEAIRVALRLQPDIAASAADRDAASERLQQANARFLPTITPQYTYISNYTFVDAGRFSNGQGGDQVSLPRSSTRETRQGDLSLRYLLYDSGQRQASARQARSSLRAAEFGEQDTRQLVIANVADRYFAVLRNEALVRVAQAQVERAQNTLDVVRAQVEAEVARRIDILQAEADLANAQVELLQARNNADVAQAQFKNALGLAGGGRLTLAAAPAPTPDTPATAVLEKGAAPAGSAAEDVIADYIALAYRARPDVARSGQTIDIDRADVRLARINSGVLITSDTALGYQFSPDSGNNREITAQVSYPLFDAGQARAQVRASEAALRASEARLQSLRQQVAVEVEQSYRLLTEARARIPAAEAAQRAAQINYDAAIESRREGVGTVVEVINAQTQLVQAQTNYVQATYDFFSADAQLARAVGQADRIAQ